MNEATSAPKGRMRLYALGGAAINTVAKLDALQINPDLLAQIDTVQIDTSISNVTTRSSNVENYLLPKLAKVDGGGKNRKENEDLIKAHIKPILKAHPPGDVNVVFSSGSGSSGSVAATNLVNELAMLGHPVVVLLIGTTASRKEAENTLETRRNYEQIAKLRNVPIVMFYLQNSATLPRAKVNEHMLSSISYLAMLFSRRNNGMDTMDLRNWLHFTKAGVTKGLIPQVYNLSVLVRENTEEGEQKFAEDLEGLGNILSVATLTRAGGITELPDAFMPEYHTEGFVADLKDSQIFNNKSVNFLITDGLFENQNDSLREFANRERPEVARSTLMAEADDEDSVKFG